MPNIWKQFKDLLPTQATQIGTVITVHSDGTVSVQLLGGGVLRVIGSAPETTRVFVRDGRITSEAPALAQVELEI